MICTDDEIQPSPALIAEARRLIGLRSLHDAPPWPSDPNPFPRFHLFRHKKAA